MEIKTSLWSLQEAIYQRLSVGPSIVALNVQVYDEVEENAVLPYITLGEDTVNDFSAKDFIGEETTVTLHTWSNYNGKKESKQILGAILKELTQTPLNVPGFIVDDLKREYINVIDEGGLYHGVIRIRIKIKPI